MIFYGVSPFRSLYFLFGVAVTLLVLVIALWIATKVMERKIKKMQDDAERGEHSHG